MTLTVYRWIWAFCPDLRSRKRYELSAVQSMHSKTNFVSMESCREDAFEHCPDLPACWGCYLYVKEYDPNTEIVKSITLVDI